MAKVGITFWAQNFHSDHSKLCIFFIINTFIAIFFWFDRFPETWPSRARIKFLEYKTNMIIFWADRWPKFVDTSGITPFYFPTIMKWSLLVLVHHILLHYPRTTRITLDSLLKVKITIIQNLKSNQIFFNKDKSVVP